MAIEKNGHAVDRAGNTVADPSINVGALVEANAKSAAMLREADVKFNDVVAAHLKEIGALRAEQAKETRAFDSERQASIRDVDMANAEKTAAQILQAVNTNASVAERTAQTLAKQVADTAAAQENRQASFASDMMKRLSAVELSMSKGEGKSGGVDQSWKVLVAVVSLIATLLVIGSIAVTVVIFLNRAPQQSPVYVSPPATTNAPPPVPR